MRGGPGKEAARCECNAVCPHCLYAYVASLAPVGASKAACNGSIIGSIMHANYAILMR